MGSPLPQDPYKVLSVSKDANLAAIRSAHRKLVLTCHPDKFPDVAVKAEKAEQFHQVQQAYELLSDDVRRSRYDERLKLAEMRAELLAHGGGARKAPADYSPRTPTATTYESRSHIHVQEVRPRAARQPEYSDSSPRYETHRTTTTRHAYDDHFEPVRRAVRLPEERRNSHDDDERIRRKAKESHDRGSTRVHAEQKKRRDKARRQDQDTKQRAYVESDSEMDSEVERFAGSRRSNEKRHVEGVRHRRDDPPRRHREDEDYSDERSMKAKHNLSSASEYIAKATGKQAIESVARGHKVSRSAGERIAVPPPPPPEAPLSSSEHIKRSSNGRRSSNTPKSSSKKIDIVDPPTSSRRQAVSSPLATPSGKSPSMRNLPRASTMDTRTEKVPSIRRTQTEYPVSHSSPSSQQAPIKKTARHDDRDSGYSSPGADQRPPYHKSTTSYKVNYSDSDGEGPHIIPIHPRDRASRTKEREMSPLSIKREHLSPHGRSSSRNMPIRSQTFNDAMPPTPRTAPLPNTRSASSRHLFGEVNYSPPLKAENILYTNTPRRGSTDSPGYPRESRDHRDHRDDYPYDRRSARGGMHQPHLSRGATYHAQDAY